MYDQLYNTFCLATCHKISLDFLRLKNPFLVAPLFWKWPGIGKGALTTESQPWPWLLIYQRLLTPLTTIFCWQRWKPMVSQSALSLMSSYLFILFVSSYFVWCHPMSSYPIICLNIYFFVLFFCLLLHPLAVRTSLPFHIFRKQRVGLHGVCSSYSELRGGGASPGAPPRATVV